jgi:hypothetical protein
MICLCSVQVIENKYRKENKMLNIEQSLFWSTFIQIFFFSLWLIAIYYVVIDIQQRSYFHSKFLCRITDKDTEV